MSIFLILFLLLLLFILLGLSADWAVENIKIIATALRIRLFVFGILLGLITTLPELALGINAIINDISIISIGNILGGVIVMLCFILGGTLLFGREIETDGRLQFVLPASVVIFSPIILGLDGFYSTYDGLIMVLLYLGLIFYLYKINHSYKSLAKKNITEKKISKAFLLSILSIVGILFISHYIIKLTTELLNYFKISQLFIGLIVFSIGTNLPEITIVLASWRKKASDLSLSLLFSSAFTNILVLGILTTISPIVFNLNLHFWLLAIFLLFTLILFIIFYHSDKKLDKKEGLILFLVYLLFLIFNLFILNIT